MIAKGIRKRPLVYVAFVFAISTLLILILVGRCQYAIKGIDASAYGEITYGMTLNEVIHVVGAVPGDYSTRIDCLPIDGFTLSSEVGTVSWISDCGIIRVRLDSDTKVIWKDFTRLTTRPDESWFDRLVRLVW